MVDMLLLKFESFENFMIDSTLMKIIHGTNFPLCLLIGSVFFCGTIYYERYGGDPLKRSLRNKLIAGLATAQLLITYTDGFGFSWRILIGPLNDQLAMLIVYLRHCSSVFIFLHLSELMIYCACSFFGWNYICAMEEDFFFTFIVLFNMGFTITSQFCRWMLGSLNNEFFELLTATFSKNIEVRLFWPVFTLTNATILFIGGIFAC